MPEDQPLPGWIRLKLGQGVRMDVNGPGLKLVEAEKLPPAAEAFLAKWSGCYLGQAARSDLAALLDEAWAEAIQEERNCLYSYLEGVRQGLDDEEKAKVLPAIAIATGRGIANLIIRNLIEATRTGSDPWEPKEEL